MTHSNGNRDDELELIRQLLIATANRTESTDAKLERLVERQDRTQRQLDQLSVNVDQLREDVEIAFQTIGLMAENADRERAIFQQETRRIWEYPLGQQQNGNGDRPQG